MRHLWWITLVLAGFGLAGCNVPCQTYCDSLTHYFESCVVDEDDTTGAEDEYTWRDLGAADAAEYQAKCQERFEQTILVANVEDRNLIYDWCTNANMAVATTTGCTGLELPSDPELAADEESDEDELGSVTF